MRTDDECAEHTAESRAAELARLLDLDRVARGPHGAHSSGTANTLDPDARCAACSARSDLVASLWSRAPSLLRELQAARALLRWAWHSRECPVLNIERDCECGYPADRAAYEAARG